MKPEIKLHWSSSKPNFGDHLSPLICEMVSGRNCAYSKIDKCDLLSTGSLLQRVKEHFWTKQIHIWGSGSIEPLPIRKSKHIYHALRGKNSASRIKGVEVKHFGDPGLLSAGLVDVKNIPKRHEIGIVPHYKDREHPTTKRLANNFKNSTIIDVFDPPLDVIQQVARCNYILSSSLHGLIVADSLKIPNHRIEISDQLRGGDWKFNDYYSVFEITTPTKTVVNESTSLSDVGDFFESYSRPNLDALKEQLHQSFPQL